MILYFKTITSVFLPANYSKALVVFGSHFLIDSAHMGCFDHSSSQELSKILD